MLFRSNAKVINNKLYEQGNIYACGKGKAYIYATEDGIKAKMTIRVK